MSLYALNPIKTGTLLYLISLVFTNILLQNGYQYGYQSSSWQDKNVVTKIKCKKAIKKANKLMNGYGRLLVRKSGTEPKIRIMAESYDKNIISKCIKMIKSSIK